MTQQQEVRGVHTAIFHDNGYQKVVYRGTVVVAWNQEVIILNSGGWYSATTKTRMNQAAHQFGLGYRVYQKDFEWFVDHNGLTLDFYDDMRLAR